jgi:hypothetical protein
MPLVDPSENDAGRRHPISPGLRRALVFVLLGPIFGALAAFSVASVMNGARVDPYGIPIAFFFCLILCAIAAPVDGVLAYVVPISLRAPLTAIVGAAVLVGICFYLWTSVGNKMVLLSLIVGAITTGTCSLLSHNYRS